MDESTDNRRAPVAGDHASVLDYRVGVLEKATTDIGASLRGIEKSLQTLTTIEVRASETREALTRAFGTIDVLNARVTLIEQALPILKLTSTWVRSGVLAVVAMIGVAVIKIVLTR